jgi:hypothetical protein
MYLRTIQRRNKDGSVVRYLQLAHNRRKGTSTQAQVLVSLGREDRLDVEGLRRLVGSIGRYLDGTRGLPAASSLPGGGTSGLLVESSRPIGATWLLDGLWRQLGIAEALRGVLDRRRFTTAVERVLFALVAGRAVAPASKLATAEWVSEDAVIPGLARMDTDQACRAMDLLAEQARSRAAEARAEHAEAALEAAHAAASKKDAGADGPLTIPGVHDDSS